MLKLGTIAFGGPAVHVAMLREETVRRRRWLPDSEFLDLFAAVSVLPGPSSTQLAIVLARRRAGWPGPVVIAVVAVAVWELTGSALRRHRERGRLAVAGLAVVGLAALAGYLASVNVLVIVAAAGLVASLVGNRRRLRPGAGALLNVLPVGLLATALQTRRRPGPALTAVAAEFLKLGVVVFGSGYALLAFLRRDLVTGLGWLSAREVLDAVVAGQVTPGPLFTTATFLPSFVLVAALEPLIGRIRRSRWAGAALDGVTVAAIGLMAGVTIDLGRTAITDPLTAVIARSALLGWVEKRLATPAPPLNGLEMNRWAVDGFVVAGGVPRA